MRILHIIVGLDVGGAELMLKRLVESHQKSPIHHHAVVSLTGIGTVGAQLRASGIVVYALGMKSALGVPRAIFKLVKLIKETNPSLVQTWMYHADLIGGISARIAGNRAVIWGVRTTDVQAGGTPVTTFLRRVCAALSRSVPQRIVCAAEASRRAHVDVGYDAARMVVVPNGFDLKRLVCSPKQREQLRRECSFGDDDIVVGILGRFNPAKDHGNFIRAAGLIANRDRRVRFLLVGRGLDAANTELVEWINATGNADRFVLLSERSDVAVCLSVMDIFCLSSRTEGFPNVVGEAMAMGVPCVVTDVGDAAMLVEDTGFVVPKENPEALAGGLRKLLSMPAEGRYELGQKAKERIKSEFTIDRARERFETLYDDVLKHNKR